MAARQELQCSPVTFCLADAILLPSGFGTCQTAPICLFPLPHSNPAPQERMCAVPAQPGPIAAVAPHTEHRNDAPSHLAVIDQDFGNPTPHN